MALQNEAEHFCKMFYSENGRVFIRRVSSMLVQRADGRVERLVGVALPDSIALYAGGESEGKGVLEIIERTPASSSVQPNTPVEQIYVISPPQRRSFSERDGFIFIAGMLATLVMCMLVFSAWIEVHDLRGRSTATARYRD